MKRTFLYVLGGLLLGGIIHIAVILLIPLFANRDAWTSMGRFGLDGAFHLLPMSEPGTEPLPYLDPDMVFAVCRFSLAERPIRVHAELRPEFWSAAIYDRRGRSIYSLNDRSAGEGGLDIVLATPVQIAQMRENPTAALETTIIVEVPVERGFILLRGFVPDRTLLAETEDALRGARCSDPVTSEGAPVPDQKPGGGRIGRV